MEGDFILKEVRLDGGVLGYVIFADLEEATAARETLY